MMIPLTLQPDRNLILTGYIQPNQPRIGRQVAQRLGRRFVDVEELIEERAGDRPEAIRAQYGERHLKAVEDDVLGTVMLMRSAVIRITGSTLATTERRELLMANAETLCLVARLDAILQRLHLAMGARYHNSAERGAALGYLRREWAVRKIAGVVELDVTYMSDPAIVDEIVAWWQVVALARG
ncbi:shikimate kinase [Aggregatilineales bacterium SYSU G02658]